MNNGNVKLNLITTELLTTESELTKLLLSKYQYEDQSKLKLTESEIMEAVSSLHYGKDYSIIDSLNPAINSLKRLKCITNYIHQAGDAFNTGTFTVTIKPVELEKRYETITEELSRRIAKPVIEPYAFNKKSFTMHLNNGEPLSLKFGGNKEEYLFFKSLYNAWVENRSATYQESNDFILKNNNNIIPKYSVKDMKGSLIKRINRQDCGNNIFVTYVESESYKLELKL